MGYTSDGTPMAANTLGAVNHGGQARNSLQIRHAHAFNRNYRIGMIRRGGNTFSRFGRAPGWRGGHWHPGRSLAWHHSYMKHLRRLAWQARQAQYAVPPDFAAGGGGAGGSSPDSGGGVDLQQIEQEIQALQQAIQQMQEGQPQAGGPADAQNQQPALGAWDWRQSRFGHLFARGRGWLDRYRPDFQWSGHRVWWNPYTHRFENR